MPFSFQVIATNGATSYSATGLPQGITINPSSGLISGTTTQTGTFPVTITVSNGGSPTTSTLYLTVYGSPTDTPTMPQWALGLLALLLLYFAGQSLGGRGCARAFDSSA